MRGCKLGQAKERGAKHWTLLHKSLANHGKPDTTYVFKFDTPKPQTSSARSSFERSTSRSWTCGTSSDAVTMALDAGTSGRLSANSLRNLEPSLQRFFVGISLQIFRSRHGRGPACLLFIGGLVWDQMAPELNSIFGQNVRSPGSQKGS